MSVDNSRNNVYRLLRIARDMKTREVAKLVGVSHVYINAIESGKSEPSLDRFSAYAKALKVDINTLFYLRDLKYEEGTFEGYLKRILEVVIDLDDKNESEEV